MLFVDILKKCRKVEVRLCKRIKPNRSTWFRTNYIVPKKQKTVGVTILLMNNLFCNNMFSNDFRNLNTYLLYSQNPNPSPFTKPSPAIPNLHYFSFQICSRRNQPDQWALKIVPKKKKKTHLQSVNFGTSGLSTCLHLRTDVSNPSASLINSLCRNDCLPFHNLFPILPGWWVIFSVFPPGPSFSIIPSPRAYRIFCRICGRTVFALSAIGRAR